MNNDNLSNAAAEYRNAITALIAAKRAAKFAYLEYMNAEAVYRDASIAVSIAEGRFLDTAGAGA